MSQLFSSGAKQLFGLAILLLFTVACRRDGIISPQPTSKKNQPVTETLPDTLWKLKQITFAVNGIPGAGMVYNTYDSTGKLTHMALNQDLGNYYGNWYFDVYYAGNYIYFYSLMNADTILTVRMDSIGRPSDYYCTHTSNPWYTSLQTGHIQYNDAYKSIAGISRVISGLPNDLNFWQFMDYGPFLKVHDSITCNYNFPPSAPADTLPETLYAYYDEVDKPDEWPIRIMRYSGILPYNPKKRITGLTYLNYGGSVVGSYTFSNHLIDYGKKLTGYESNGIPYRLEWQAFPQ